MKRKQNYWTESMDRMVKTYRGNNLKWNKADTMDYEDVP